MRAGAIGEAARSDSRFMVWVSALILTACLVVLGVHTRYIYNWVSGPSEATPSLLADPGFHRFVRLDGKLQPSGIVEETSKRLGHVIETSREETAEFLIAEIGGREVIVKVPREFAGSAVEGRLVEVPERLRAMIQPAPIYPWMIDAEHSFRGDWNLPLVLALVLVLPCAWWFRGTLRRAQSIDRHPQLAKLVSHGAPLEVADRIEREMRALGEPAHVGLYWISPAWFVRPKPLLVIHHGSEIAGIATRTRTVKNVTKHEVIVWRAGSASADTDAMTESEVATVAGRVAACMPWAVVGDAEAFARRWRDDRIGEEAAARERYA
jgi:hypothetical protein